MSDIMNEFFNNKDFINRMNNLPNLSHKKTRIFDVMKEIKEKNPYLTIDVFLAILDKQEDQNSSSLEISAFLYKYSVELWNQHVFDNYKCDLDLLISYKDICF